MASIEVPLTGSRDSLQPTISPQYVPVLPVDYTKLIILVGLGVLFYLIVSEEEASSPRAAESRAAARRQDGAVDVAQAAAQLAAEAEE